MKRVVSKSWALLSLLATASPALAGGPACGHCCEAPCVPVLRAEVTEHKYTVEVPVHYGYTTVWRDVWHEVPCCRLVPVCVTDPCTGCKRTEYKQETIMERVKTTYIDLVPPKEECGCKIEQRSRYCTKIYIDHRPAPVCCPAPCCCH
jgi:hypothetical protein